MKTDIGTVTIYCDGAASNQGGLREHHAGYAAILVYGSHEKIATGHVYPATSSVAEVLSLITGLEQIKKPCFVEVFSDSQYVVRGVNIWLAQWEQKNFRGVAHANLWRQISDFKKRYPIHANWIRGHAKPGEQSEHQKYNVKCDELAVAEAWKSYQEITGDKA